MYGSAGEREPSAGNAVTHAAERLDEAAADSPERIFLRAAESLTFGEVASASHAVAAWLRRHGVRPGDRMMIVTRNHPESVAAAFGAARCGVTTAFLHHAIGSRGLAHVVRQVAPSCVVLDGATLSLRAFVRGLPLLLAGVSAQGGSRIATLPTPDRGGRDDTERRDPLFLVYTSGSTGEPRGVMVSHANVAFTSRAIRRRLRYGSDDIIGLYLPLSFDYGLYQIFLALEARACVYFGTVELAPLQLCATLASEAVTVLPGMPLLFSSLVRLLERRPRPLPRLRAVTNTGEPLPPAILDALRARLPDVDVFLMYGLTECKRVSILMPGELEAHPQSVGRPLDGTDVTVLDAHGREVPDGTSGELAVAGPHVTMGYWGAAEETARRFRPAPDGTRQLLTGDIGWRSADGYLYVDGRDDALVKHRGIRMSLLEIESAATAASGASCAAVVAPPYSDRLHLFLTGGRRTDVGTVIRELRSRLEPHKWPDRVHVIAELPMTAHGKVDRAELRTFAEAAR
jgi:long-chain acyl-CoA synthetase